MDFDLDFDFNLSYPNLYATEYVGSHFPVSLQYHGYGPDGLASGVGIASSLCPQSSSEFLEDSAIMQLHRESTPFVLLFNSLGMPSWD